jgi:hypothetical protein
MPAAVAARAAGDGRPAAIAARPVPDEAAAADVAGGWSVAPGREVTAPGARKRARTEAAAVVLAAMVLPGRMTPRMVAVLPGAAPVPLGAMPPLPVVAPVPLGGVPVPPGEVPVLPGALLVPGEDPVPPGAVPAPGGVTTAWAVPSTWLSTEVADVVVPLTELVAVVTIAWVVPGRGVTAEMTGAVMLLTVRPADATVSLPVVTTRVTVEVTVWATGAVTAETVPLTEDVTAFPVDATRVTAGETGPAAAGTVPVSEDVTALPAEATWLPAEATWLPAEDAAPPAEDTELAAAEVADWPAEDACPAADWTVPAAPDDVLPMACVAACVAADAVDVTAESGVALADVVGVAAGALDADPEPVTVEAAVWAVEAACPAAEDRPPATEEVLVATPPAGPSWAVVALGLVTADADRAVRREKATAAPMAAIATPAAQRQYRRIPVTSPLVTASNLVRSGRIV